MDDEDGDLCVGDDGGGDAAEEMSNHPVTAVGAEHDEAGVPVVCDLDDALPGWRCPDRQAF